MASLAVAFLSASVAAAREHSIRRNKASSPPTPSRNSLCLFDIVFRALSAAAFLTTAVEVIYAVPDRSEILQMLIERWKMMKILSGTVRPVATIQTSSAVEAPWASPGRVCSVERRTYIMAI